MPAAARARLRVDARHLEARSGRARKGARPRGGDRRPARSSLGSRDRRSPRGRRPGAARPARASRAAGRVRGCRRAGGAYPRPSATRRAAGASARPPLAGEDPRRIQHKRRTLRHTPSARMSAWVSFDTTVMSDAAHPWLGGRRAPGRSPVNAPLRGSRRGSTASLLGDSSRRSGSAGGPSSTLFSSAVCIPFIAVSTPSAIAGSADVDVGWRRSWPAATTPS
jgi:hypothetical protein